MQTTIFVTTKSVSSLELSAKEFFFFFFIRRLSMKSVWLRAWHENEASGMGYDWKFDSRTHATSIGMIFFLWSIPLSFMNYTLYTMCTLPYINHIPSYIYVYTFICSRKINNDNEKKNNKKITTTITTTLVIIINNNKIFFLTRVMSS